VLRSRLLFLLSGAGEAERLLSLLGVLDPDLRGETLLERLTGLRECLGLTDRLGLPERLGLLE